MEYSNSKIMNSLIFLFSFLSLVFLLVSCGKKEVKQVSEDSKITQESFMLADVIKNAYIKNDLSTLEKNTTKDSYKDIIEARKYFDSSDLSFTPHWVEIDGATVNLQVSWKGTWTVKGRLRSFCSEQSEESPSLLRLRLATSLAMTILIAGFGIYIYPS